MDLIQSFGFNYISLLYAEGSYGESAAKYIEKEVKTRGMCFAYSRRLARADIDDELVQKLVENHKARVVILFMYESYATKLFMALERAGIFDYFIFVTSDSPAEVNYGLSANGYFYISFEYGEIYQPFADYYHSLTPDDSSNNPWMKPLWEKYYDCEWHITNTSQIQNDCTNYSNIPYPDYPITIWANKYYDGAKTFGLAFDAMFRQECPEVFSDISHLDQCMDGQKLLSYLKKVSFEGLSGKVCHMNCCNFPMINLVPILF